MSSQSDVTMIEAQSKFHAIFQLDPTTIYPTYRLTSTGGIFLHFSHAVWHTRSLSESVEFKIFECQELYFRVRVVHVIREPKWNIKYNPTRNEVTQINNNSSV